MRERELDQMQEQKRQIIDEQGGWCACGCGLPAVDLAHVIPQTKPNLAKYGPEVIHHRLNLRAVAHRQACNDAMSIGCKPWSEGRLVERIRAALESETKEVRP